MEQGSKVTKKFTKLINVRVSLTGIMKLHMDLVVLVKKMSVLINFLLQNTNLVSVMSDRTDEFCKLCIKIK